MIFPDLLAWRGILLTSGKLLILIVSCAQVYVG